MNYERDLHNTKLFFWVQQITVNYLDCQVPKETYTCRNPSINMERTDEIKERRQLLASFSKSVFKKRTDRTEKKTSTKFSHFEEKQFGAMDIYSILSHKNLSSN